jgi:hypothetical protein
MSYQALTQPASIGRVLDSGFKLFVSSFNSVLILIVVTAIISVIMQYAIFQIMLPAAQLHTEEDMQLYMMSVIPQLTIVGLTMWIISLILYNAILSRIGMIATGEPGELFDALITGAKKALPVFLAAILYGIAVMIGWMLLVIPGLIVMLTLIFFQVLIVVDDEGILASLKKSHNLVWGNYWRTAAVILIPVFIIYALIFVVAFIAGFVGMYVPTEMEHGHIQTSFGLFDMLIAAVSVAMVPLLDAVFIAHVNDLKLRKSGADLEQRLQA